MPNPTSESEKRMQREVEKFTKTAGGRSTAAGMAAQAQKNRVTDQHAKNMRDKKARR
jgi:hypothetical protein